MDEMDDLYRNAAIKESPFADELRRLLNRYCMENDSNTPDYILADYLLDCLMAFNSATRERTRWNAR